MGWGTHEKTLPPGAHVHRAGPMNQICLARPGCQTWGGRGCRAARSWAWSSATARPSQSPTG
jgi:homospermidine synthase